MSAIQLQVVPAPWPEYLEMPEDALIDRLERKVRGAEDWGDQAYALAVTSAVACYEAIRLRDSGEQHDALRTRAEELHEIAMSWEGS
jgi:hypothetical protein